MYQISTIKSGNSSMAFLTEQPDEYWETGSNRYEAIGKLLENLIENKIIDTIEINDISSEDRLPEAVIDMLQKGDIDRGQIAYFTRE